MRYGSSHVDAHRRPARAEGEEGRRLRHRLAGLESWREAGPQAVELLEEYRDRYRPVAGLAGLASEFDAAGPLEIVEDHVGVGSTDFWAISFAPSSFEQGPMPTDELERKLALLEAAWRFFDDMAARVSPELEKGPRGGGRDRDQIVRHVVGNERGDLARKVGVLLLPTIR